MKLRLNLIVYCLLLVCINVVASSSSSSSSSDSAGRSRAATEAVPSSAPIKEGGSKTGSVSGKISPSKKDDYSSRIKQYKKAKERFDKAMGEGDVTEIEKWLKALELMYGADQFDGSEIIAINKELNIDIDNFIKDKRALFNRYKEEAAKQHGEVAAFADYFRINLSQLNRSLDNFKKVMPDITASYDLIAVVHEAFNIQEQWSSLKDFVDFYELSNLILHEMGKKEPRNKVVWQTLKASIDKKVAEVAKNSQQLLQEYKNLCAEFDKAAQADNQKEAVRIKKLIDDQFKIDQTEAYKVSHVPDIVEILKINYEMNKFFSGSDQGVPHSEVTMQLEKLKDKGDQSKANALPKRLSKEADTPISDFIVDWDKELDARIAQVEKSFAAVQNEQYLINMMKSFMNLSFWCSDSSYLDKKILAANFSKDKLSKVSKELKEYAEKKRKKVDNVDQQVRQQIKKVTVEELTLMRDNVNKAYNDAEEVIKNIRLHTVASFDRILGLLQEVLPQYILLLIAFDIEDKIARKNHVTGEAGVHGEESAASTSKEMVLKKNDFEKSTLLTQTRNFEVIVEQLAELFASEDIQKNFSAAAIKRWRSNVDSLLFWVHTKNEE